MAFHLVLQSFGDDGILGAVLGARLVLAGTGGASQRLAVLVAVVHVLGEGARVREALSALGADKRLLARVEAAMLGEMVLVLECLATLPT